jgi:hypothetical protein
MIETIDYYRVLGVSPFAEDVVIRAAYKALAQRYHPDKWRENPAEAAKRMTAINEAFAVLSDSERRRTYDDDLHSKRRTESTPPAQSSSPRPKSDREPSSNRETEKHGRTNYGFVRHPFLPRDLEWRELWIFGALGAAIGVAGGCLLLIVNLIGWKHFEFRFQSVREVLIDSFVFIPSATVSLLAVGLVATLLSKLKRLLRH